MKNKSEKKTNEVSNNPPVLQISTVADETIVSLIDKWDHTAFNAKRLAQACKIYGNMCRDPDCVKFLAISGAMVPAGMQRVIYDLIAEGFVDVIVTTGANITHDIAEALGEHHLQGFPTDTTTVDAELHTDHMNRIFDVFMPNEIYEKMEDWLRSFTLSQTASIKETIWSLGEHLPADAISFVRVCASKHIPIYCPAFTDSGIGMQIAFRYPNVNLNHFQDLQEFINLAWDTKVPGICIIGGGVPKNYIFQAMQFSPNAAKYVIQITTDVQVTAGGLSSASLSEAISWGKIDPKGQIAQVHIDATVVCPILLIYLKALKASDDIHPKIRG